MDRSFFGHCRNIFRAKMAQPPPCRKNVRYAYVCCLWLVCTAGHCCARGRLTGLLADWCTDEIEFYGGRSRTSTFNKSDFTRHCTVLATVALSRPVGDCLSVSGREHGCFQCRLLQHCDKESQEELVVGWGDWYW